MPLMVGRRRYFYTWEIADEFEVTTQTVRCWISDYRLRGVLRVYFRRDGTAYVNVIPASEVARLRRVRS